MYNSWNIISVRFGSWKIKIYIYTKISKAMQTDGYSLDAQKARIKAFADYNDYEVIVKLAGNPKFAAMMQEKLNSKVNTAATDGELAAYEKQLL